VGGERLTGAIFAGVIAALDARISHKAEAAPDHRSPIFRSPITEVGFPISDQSSSDFFEDASVLGCVQAGPCSRYALRAVARQGAREPGPSLRALPLRSDEPDSDGPEGERHGIPG
jgi:hypothetical protein